MWLLLVLGPCRLGGFVIVVGGAGLPHRENVLFDLVVYCCMSGCIADVLVMVISATGLVHHDLFILGGIEIDKVAFFVCEAATILVCLTAWHHEHMLFGFGAALGPLVRHEVHSEEELQRFVQQVLLGLLQVSQLTGHQFLLQLEKFDLLLGFVERLYIRSEEAVGLRLRMKRGMAC